MPLDKSDRSAGASKAAHAERLCFGDHTQSPMEVAVAVEVPVNVIYGNSPYAVMMMSPADLPDFAYGFSLTEGIIQSVGEIRKIEFSTAEEGISLTIDLVPDRFREHLSRRRAMSGRTSCGLCGIESLAALPSASPLSTAAQLICSASIRTALTALERMQPLNQLTRSVHAAAWCHADGRVLLVREDVGRHNALDKLIGALLVDGSPASQASAGFMMITSRASFEMVEKAAIFGARCLVAISAPTSLAIKRADDLGVTLVAIARSDAAMVFTGAVSLGHAALEQKTVSP